MDYGKLAKSLRQCAEGSCAGCKNDLVQIGCRGMLQREAADAIEELLKAAKKMHTWIFLHTGDEQKAYDECGLSEDMNIALGYSGQIEFRAKKQEEDRGCPPDYNPGFCYGDEDCDACWEGWRKEQGDEL